MNIHESAEDYLEAILMLCEEHGFARSVDIAALLSVSKPSVSFAMRRLKDNGYILVGNDNHIKLTESGETIAKRVLGRHRLLTTLLVSMGVSEEIARNDACKLEHDLSDESFDALSRCPKLMEMQNKH